MARTMNESEAASWERVEKLRELIAAVDRDLAMAIRRRSPTLLSQATQSITNSGIELTRLLGRLEEARGDF